jgi:pyroglutamyl-peptidase
MNEKVKVLLTGFDVFGDLTLNTSQLIVESIDTCAKRSFLLYTEVLPTSYRRSFLKLKELLLKYQPDVIVMLGVDSGVSRVRIESGANNNISLKLPDNDDYVPEDKFVVSSAPMRLETTLDPIFITKRLREVGFTVEISDDCGDYICNFIYFKLLHFVQKTMLSMNAIFVHVPNISDATKSETFLLLDTLIQITITIIIAAIDQL